MNKKREIKRSWRWTSWKSQRNPYPSTKQLYDREYLKDSMKSEENQVVERKLCSSVQEFYNERGWGRMTRATKLLFYRFIGEPILHPELSNGAAVTQTHLCPLGEQTRRNELNKYKCFVKVLFNNKEVSRTQSK